MQPGGDRMNRLFMVLGGAVLPAAIAMAQAPPLNVEATCRATPAVNLDQQGTYDNCIRSENAARDRLGKTWDDIRADWRSTCLKTTTLGGIPSYVELLTCVEMREAAANITSAPEGTKNVGYGTAGAAVADSGNSTATGSSGALMEDGYGTLKRFSR